MRACCYQPRLHQLFFFLCYLGCALHAGEKKHLRQFQTLTIWNSCKKKTNKNEARQDPSIKVDNNNHRSDVPVKAYSYSICTLLDLLSIFYTHYSLSHPSLSLSVCRSQYVSPSLPFSFPLVVSAIIIPLFFEVFVKSKAPKQSPNMWIHGPFKYLGSYEVAHSWNIFSLKFQQVKINPKRVLF